MKENKPKDSILNNEGIVVLLSVLCTFLWGTCYPAVKLCYQYFNIADKDIFSQITAAGVRFIVAGLISFAVTAAVNGRLTVPTGKSIRNIFLLGLVLTTFQYLFFYIGYANTSGVRGSILYATSSFIAVIISHFIYKDDRINLKKLVGCIIGFAGVCIMNIKTGSSGTESFRLIGDGFILIAATAFGVGSIISKIATKDHDSFEVSAYQMFIGGAFLVMIGMLGGGSFDHVSFKGILSLAYMGIVSAVTFTMWSALLKYNSVGKIAVYNFLVPVFGVILSALILKESIYRTHFISLILVCIGIIVVNYQPWKKRLLK